LVEKLQLYFELNTKSLDKSTSQDMYYLFKLLPATLKINLSKFLNKDAIEVAPFLQDRPDTFILNYLDKFQPMRFEVDDVIFEANSKSREMYINIGGEILNIKTKRVL
jgi:hypothetical protein